LESKIIGDVGKYLDARAAEKVEMNMAELECVLDAPDARIVRDKLTGGGIDIAAAIGGGDADAIRDVVAGIAGSPEGARLISRIRDILK
jgi:hypothetical protein